MSISQRLAADKQKATKPAAAAATSAKSAAASDKDEEGMEEEDEGGSAEGEEPKPEGKKAKAKSTAASEEDDAEAEGEEAEEEMAATAADPGTVAQLCAEAGVPSMAKPLIDAKLPLGKVKAKIASAGTIRTAVTTAGRICRTIDPKMAEGFIANGASVEHVKAEMFDMIVKAQGPEIRNSHTAAGGAAPTAGTYGWDKTVEKLNARHQG